MELALASNLLMMMASFQSKVNPDLISKLYKLVAEGIPSEEVSGNKNRLIN